MRRELSAKFAVALVAGLACSAFGQESRTYTGVNSNEGQGNAANEFRTASLVGGYPIGSIIVSGTLTEVNTGTFASEADLRVVSPSGAIYVLNPFTTGGFTGSISVTGYTFNFPVAEADAVGDWTIEFYESFNDGAGTDAVWDTITLDFVPTVPPPPPPANDNCADAIATAVGGTYPGNTATGTNDATGSCGTSATAKDVWYSFEAPSDGTFTFSTCDAVGFDTVLSLWDTCGGAELFCDDDTDFTCSFSGLRSEIRRTMTTGETVLVRLAGYNGASGAYVLHVGDVTPPPPPPANDDCAGAIAIGNGADQPYTTVSATDSGIAIATCGLPITIHNDVYFTYQADCTGVVEMATCGTTYDTVIAVFDACGGTQIACNDDAEVACTSGSALGSRLTFNAVAGTTYTVAVGAYLTNVTGAGLLSISCTPDFVCPSADFNQDGFTDFFDYDDYVACFEGAGAPGCNADFNGDQFVDFFDYDDFVYAFEGCP